MEPTRIFDLLDNYRNRYIKEDALAVKKNGKWIKYSSEDYTKMTDYLSFGLLELNLKKGDKIVTVSNNRPEWNIMDMAMLQAGIIHVPTYPTISEKEYKHVISHSEAKYIFISSKELYDKIKPITSDIPSLTGIYTIDNIDGIDNITSLIELGKKNEEKHKQELAKIKDSITPDEIASIIYTSGTTGLSKGVMLSHNNIISNVMASRHRLLPTIGQHSKIISFLPLCHVFERMVNYFFQYFGTSIYYAESIETIGDNIREISPDGFTAVPRILEKVYDKIVTKGKNLTGIKKGLFFWALNLGLKYEFDNANGFWYEFKLKIANKIIFNKWREALGGNVSFIVSGGAALQPRLARVFWSARIPVQEGYGLSETAPVIAVNGYKTPNIKFETVGPIVDNVTVKINDDGEILVKGPNVMLGYYKNQELTDTVIDKDGWFHTGDIGELVDDKFLKITDRKKEIFKLSTGKYVAPQIVENQMKESMFIEQIMIIGDGKKYTAAIVSPSFDYLTNYCKIHKITESEFDKIIAHPRVVERFEKEIEKFNEKLGKTRKVKKFKLVPHSWTAESGELSTTLKLKRRILKERYKDLIEEIYNDDEEKA